MGNEGDFCDASHEKEIKTRAPVRLEGIPFTKPDGRIDKSLGRSSTGRECAIWNGEVEVLVPLPLPFV